MSLGKTKRGCDALIRGWDGSKCSLMQGYKWPREQGTVQKDVTSLAGLDQLTVCAPVLLRLDSVL
jgi:hypothetical protein